MKEESKLPSVRGFLRKVLKYIAYIPPLLLLFDLIYAFAIAIRKTRRSSMCQVRTQDALPQKASPLYNKIPPEIRNTIFQLALTAYDDPTRKYRPAAHYYRPGFTCAHKIDTNLLLTCRRVYAETARLPASMNEHTSWYFRPPPGISKNEIPLGNSPGALVRQRDLRTIHVFAQQYWLEGAHGGFAGFVRLWNIARPTHLKITIRHSDWWWWEVGEPIALDAKRQGRPSSHHSSRPSDPFEPGSWGARFRDIEGLDVLQLELETLEYKKTELDAIIDQAKGWQFPLGDSRVLLLNELKTKRMGWIGVPIDQNFGFRDDIDDFVTNIPEETGGDDNGTVSNEDSMPLAQGSLAAHSDPASVDHIIVGEISTNWPDAVLGASSHAIQGGDPSEMPVNHGASQGTAPKVLTTPRQRLEAAGVVFDDFASDTCKSTDETCTYYVVTLTWEAH
ncbi:MAG: hypothetical protein Q9203_005376 [Teloschistes exilis]